MSRKQKTEFYRKSIHVSSILIPFAYRFIAGGNKKIAVTALIPLVLIALFIDVSRLESKTFKKKFHRIFGFMLRKHEDKFLTGATFLMTSSVLCISFFPGIIAFTALSFLSVGDTFAALIGIPFGKRKLFGTKKSLEGTLACFISTFVFSLFFFHVPWPQGNVCLYGFDALVISLVGAFSATVAEFSDINIDDNFKIPVFSGIVMTIAYLILT
ncbi:MAG: phosphatidate cytidylyltransferase [Candidatus Cloacimonadota bacterium]|nr:MAG: phosphatidate cytidylyltransferase [Candidatus Cloacimonadota bacterium]